VAFERITFDPDKIGGQPCIRGPRTSGDGRRRLELTAETAGQDAEKKPTFEPTIRSQGLLAGPVALQLSEDPLPESRTFATGWDLWGFDGTIPAQPTDQKVGGSSPSKRAQSPQT